MNPTTPLDALINSVLAALQRPGVFIEFAILLLAVALAWGLDRRYRRRYRAIAEARSGARRLGEGGLMRLVFPLGALLVLSLGRALMRRWQETHLLDVAVPLFVSMGVVRMAAFALRQAFPPSSWLAAAEKVLALVVWAVLALHILGWLPELIAGMEAVKFSIGTQQLSLWLILQGALTVLLTLLFALWLSGLIEQRLLRASSLNPSLQLVFSRLTKAALILVAVLIALPLVGIDLTTLSVFGGALGVGLGFGMQKIAANYVSGFIILLDRSISIGNMVSVGTDRGVVSQITTRYTVLRGLNGVEVLVPNETLVSSVVQNETFTDTRTLLPIDIQVSYGADLERAMAIMVEEAARVPRVLADPPPKAYLVNFADSGINLRVGLWLGDPREGSLGVVSDINLAVWRRFRDEGIEIPFPQREVRILPPLPAFAAGVPAGRP